MKESIRYWTVACSKSESASDASHITLSQRRYISVHGEVRDFSAHCMIEDQKTALDFANTIQQDPAGNQRSGQLTIEPVHILISYREKARLERRIADQTKAVQNYITRRALEML